MIPTRGERNNNPGNIREYRDDPHWQGERATDDDKSFEEFNDPIYGIRALAKVLLNYQRNGYDSIRKIINRYAPSVENNTQAYINAVCKSCSIEPDTKIDVRNYNAMFGIVSAIIQHENGRNIYSPAQIDTGIRLALSGIGNVSG